MTAKLASVRSGLRPYWPQKVGKSADPEQ